MMYIFFNIIVPGYLMVGLLLLLLFFNPEWNDGPKDEQDFNMLEKILILILAWLPVYAAVIRQVIKKVRDRRAME